MMKIFICNNTYKTTFFVQKSLLDLSKSNDYFITLQSAEKLRAINATMRSAKTSYEAMGLSPQSQPSRSQKCLKFDDISNGTRYVCILMTCYLINYLHLFDSWFGKFLNDHFLYVHFCWDSKCLTSLWQIDECSKV